MKKIVMTIVLSMLFIAGCQAENMNTGTATPSTDVTHELTVTSTSAPDAAPTTDKDEFVSSRMPGRSDFNFITTKNNEKTKYSENLTIPSYVDVISISKMIDDTDIYFYIELREIPSTLTVNYDKLRSNILEYCWYISFDADSDGSVDNNVTFNHHKFTESQKSEEQVSIDSDAFQTVVLQHQTRTDYTVAEGEFYIEGNTMVFHIDKEGREELVKVTEDTPFCILSECVMPGYYFCDIIPEIES